MSVCSHAQADWPMDFEAWRQLFPRSGAVERVMALALQEAMAIPSFRERSPRDQSLILSFQREGVEEYLSSPYRNAEVLDLISSEITKNGWRASILGLAFPGIQTIFNLRVIDVAGDVVFDGHIGELGLTHHHVTSHQFEITGIRTARSSETAKFLAAIATRALPDLPSKEGISAVETVIENFLANGILANIGVGRASDSRVLQIEGFLDWPGSPIFDSSKGLIPSLSFFPNSLGKLRSLERESWMSFQLHAIGVRIEFATATTPLSIKLNFSQFYATRSQGPSGPTLSLSPYSSGHNNFFSAQVNQESGESLQKTLTRAVGEFHGRPVSESAWYGIAEGMAGLGHRGYQNILKCRKTFKE